MEKSIEKQKCHLSINFEFGGRAPKNSDNVRTAFLVLLENNPQVFEEKITHQ
jgi:hypothetical protein